ncbi:MAG: hypothetical protein NTU83_05170 [Candidatus Hydrogenedentes bacterium]|nr:hypothetical protein [Candidatus Hydrogenedentota bacterium]
MRKSLLYMAIAVAGLGLVGCPPQQWTDFTGPPVAFTVCDKNAQNGTLADFSGTLYLCSDGTLKLENNHSMTLTGTHTDDWPNVTFEAELARSTHRWGHQVNELYRISGTLVNGDAPDGIYLTGTGNYSITYLDLDCPEASDSVVGDCTMEGFWSSFNESMASIWSEFLPVFIAELSLLLIAFKI